MPRVATAFFAMGSLFVLSGMILGEYMGASENMVLAPVHAHINLLGWVCLALYGTFYALTKDTYSPRLAWTNFVLSTVGVIATAPMLGLLLTTGDTAHYGPMVGATAGIALLGLLVFMISVFRELVRKRA